MKQVIVTTSWDDGHTLDVRLAALLQKYGVAATFYVSPRDHEFTKQQRLTDQEIVDIAKDFEIGAHTMTHPRLATVSDAAAKQEIVGSKRYLEKLLGKKITSFCYPCGSYRKRHIPLVRGAGFTYARTVKRHAYGFEGAPFEAETTVNTYNHYQDLWKIAKFAKFNPWKIRYFFQWENLAKAMFDRIQERGGVFHLWGHSWEVDGHGDWEKLEDVLRHISGKRDVQYATNNELMAHRPKRLLMAIPYFPPHTGGTEFYCFNISKILQERLGWDVSIATSGKRGLYRPTKRTYKGLDIYELPYWFKLSNTPVNPLWSFALKRIIKCEQIDVVDAHTPVPYFADVAAIAAKKKPFILTYHHAGTMQKGNGQAIDIPLKLYERYGLSRVLRQAARIITTSDFPRDGFLRSYLPKSITITPAVDVEFFAPVRKKPGKTILFVAGILGKSSRHKGLRYLLEAFRLVLEAHPDSSLIVVGDGDERAAYEALAHDLGVSERVSFLGLLYGNDLRKQYQSADMLAIPSLAESFGMVIVEAMACGLPVVGSRVDGIPLVVQDKMTGYLVPPADSEALAERMNFLLAHPDTAEKLGKAARKRVVDNFTWLSRAEQTNALLRRCLGVAAESEKS